MENMEYVEGAALYGICPTAGDERNGGGQPCKRFSL